MTFEALILLNFNQRLLVQKDICRGLLYSHMAQLMGDGKRSAESIVLTDAAAPVRITHRPQLRKSCITQELSYFSHMMTSTHSFLVELVHLPNVSHLSLALQMSCLW